MKPGDIIMWYSVGPQQRCREHIKRFAELVSFEANGRYATLKVVEDNKDVLLSGICKTLLEPLNFKEEEEFQFLKGNNVNARGSVSEYVPKDYSVYKDLSQETYSLLDKIEASGKRIYRIDLFGEDIEVRLEDDSKITRKFKKPLDHLYALRKWYNIRSQSWGPLEA